MTTQPDAPERSAETIAAPVQPAPLSQHFTCVVLDETPSLLEESYRLRFQVYCQERHFLPPENYRDGKETDLFDQHSVHFGVLNVKGEIAATARLVQPNGDGYPLRRHCTLFPQELPFDEAPRQVVEVSRLSVSRQYNRRAGDDHYSLSGPKNAPGGNERRSGGELVLSLYRGLYQESKRRGFTHWIMATERALLRLVAKYAFPFRAVGPESDYYGMVCPYLMDLREFDDEILSGRIPRLSEFLDGLPAPFRPLQRQIRTGTPQ